MYVLSGELEISVEQQVYYLHKDDISVTFPDKIHSLNTPESSQVLLLVFDVDFLQDFRPAFTECIPVNPILNLNNLTEHGKNALNWLITLSKNMPATADMPNIEDAAITLLSPILPRLLMNRRTFLLIFYIPRAILLSC